MLSPRAARPQKGGLWIYPDWESKLQERGPLDSELIQAEYYLRNKISEMMPPAHLHRAHAMRNAFIDTDSYESLVNEAHEQQAKQEDLMREPTALKV